MAHKKLDIWRLSIQFIKNIYKLTEKFPNSELYGLTNQMRRASISITSNIAEGSSRSSALERRRYYEIPRSSLVEIDSQLEVAFELGFLNEKELNDFNDKVELLFAKLTNFILSVK